LSAFLNWCVGEDLIELNIATGIERNEETPRDRRLKDAELKTLWNTLPPGDFGDIVRLLILTGQRLREISDLRWSEIDLNEAVIELPRHRTKNGEPHTIPLSKPVLDILKRRQRNTERDLIFGIGTRGFGGWSKSKARLDKAVRFSKPWILHDIRRSVSTGMNELGVEPHIVEAVLNHISGHKAGVAGTYNRAAYEKQKVEALNRWASHVLAVAGDRRA
jgi:integrase